MKKLFTFLTQRILWLLLFLAPFSLRAQNILPNLSYNGQLTSACSTPNGACTNAVFVTTLGTSGAPQSSGAGSTLDIPVANYAAVTVTISGTYSGVTIGFDFSDPTAGTNYFQEVCARTDVNILEASEAVPTNQVRAWQCPVWAALRFRVRASAFGSGSPVGSPSAERTPPARASSSFRCMSSSGAGLPVHNVNAAAPWWRSINSPSWTVEPAASASRRKRVRL